MCKLIGIKKFPNKKRRFFMSPNKAKAISGKILASVKRTCLIQSKLKLLGETSWAKGSQNQKIKFQNSEKWKFKDGFTMFGIIIARGTLSFIQGPYKVKINEEFLCIFYLYTKKKWTKFFFHHDMALLLTAAVSFEYLAKLRS